MLFKATFNQEFFEKIRKKEKDESNWKAME